MFPLSMYFFSSVMYILTSASVIHLSTYIIHKKTVVEKYVIIILGKSLSHQCNQIHRR